MTRRRLPSSTFTRRPRRRQAMSAADRKPRRAQDWGRRQTTDQPRPYPAPVSLSLSPSIDSSPAGAHAGTDSSGISARRAETAKTLHRNLTEYAPIVQPGLAG